MSAPSASHPPPNHPSPPQPPPSLVPTITPAALGSLAIYNPSLGPTDETIQNQIVFYTSRHGQDITDNEKLRQIGLAQGVAEFARGFAKTNNCTSVETQKSRIVMLEIEEPGWWILAQIDLTYILNPTTTPPTSEYSSREVAPAQLLQRQLRAAYRQFRFHYGTFDANLSRLGRTVLRRRLEKYWLRWAWGRWEVMLNASPIVDVFVESSIKMAAGRPRKEIREQEREFLDGWVKKERQRGLVDMVVSRFGEPPADDGTMNDAISQKGEPSESGNGSGFWFWSSGARATSPSDSLPEKESVADKTTLQTTDGCVFRGIGALEAQSVQDIATYMGELYRHNEEPTRMKGGGVRRKKRLKRSHGLSHVSTVDVALSSAETTSKTNSLTVTHSDGERTDFKGQSSVFAETERGAEHGENGTEATAQESAQNTLTRNSKLLNMITFSWSARSHGDTTDISQAISDGSTEPPTNNSSATPNHTHSQQEKQQRGRFIIGFQGKLDVEDMDDDDESSSDRITSRNVWVSRVTLNEISSDAKGHEQERQRRDSEDLTITTYPLLEEFKIVVYNNPPFMFAFIFSPTTPHLTSPAFYRSLHHQLSPLISPLLTPSSPAKSSLKTLASTSSPPKPPYEILYHANEGTLYSTLPPIPEPGADLPGWSRVDALHVYTIALGILLDEPGARERSARSTRGWWISWVRLDEGEGVMIKRPGADGHTRPEARRYLEGLFKDVES